MQPIIGIPCSLRPIEETPFAAIPARYGEALLKAADAVAVLIPPEGGVMLAVLDRLDGLLFPGSPSNVAPELYGAKEDLTPGKHDPARDRTTLPLINAALARGLPLLAICRGIQELNVALGGSLYQKVQDLPGHFDHRGGPGSREVRYGPKHSVALSGELARLIGRDQITVNSLHQQAIERPAERLKVEAVAADGTIEAVRVLGPRSFAFGVQWHPEWDVLAHPDRLALFRAFGDAARAFRAGLPRAA